MKKILIGLFGLITFGLINFSSAVNYSCSDSSFTITEDSYFIINYAGGSRAGIINIGNNSISVEYCYTSNRGITVDSSCSPINSYPLVLTPGTWYITCSNITVSSFSVFPSESSCPTCPNCSQCESDLLSCQSSLSGANSDLLNCQSSLSGANSDLSTCQLTLSGYVNTLDNLSNNLQTCNSSLNACLQANCPEVEVPDVQWSAFWVNNTQIQGASSIYLYLPDFLNWDYTYFDTGSTLQIDVENEGDQEYINNILDIQSYHPDKDQFAQSFAGFLTLLMPYIIITLFIVFVWRLIRRIFK